MKISRFENGDVGTDDARFQRFTQGFAGWTVQVVDLPGGGEDFCWRRKLIQIDPRTKDLERALAHAAAHLALHGRNGLVGQVFSPEQEMEADWLADMWLSWSNGGEIPFIDEVA